MSYKEEWRLFLELEKGIEWRKRKYVKNSEIKDVKFERHTEAHSIEDAKELLDDFKYYLKREKLSDDCLLEILRSKNFIIEIGAFEYCISQFKSLNTLKKLYNNVDIFSIEADNLSNALKWASRVWGNEEKENFLKKWEEKSGIEICRECFFPVGDIKKSENCWCGRCPTCLKMISDCICEKCSQCNTSVHHCLCERCPDCNKLTKKCKCYSLSFSRRAW